jgi:predicted acylesterase/phospholipase RssA
MTRESAAALAATELFRELDAATLAALVAALEPMRLAGGQPLFLQGEPGDAAYLVLSGRLRVERARDGRLELIREMGRGELVGELALLTGAMRSASVRAVRDTELGRLPRDRFIGLLHTHPPLAIEITRMLAGLLAAPPRPPDAGAGVSTVMVRAAGRDAPAAAVAKGLTDALAGAGRAALVSSAAADAALVPGAAQAARDDPRYADTARWLDQVEREHDQVVYLADDGPTTWTGRCLRHADLILHVAGAGDRPATHPDAAEATASGRLTAEDLVLVHPADAPRRRETARWLDQRPFGRRHHLRLGSAEDFGRLARRLTGRAVGVALSGGGARALAHIGFLKAVEELGIPVDEIGGTSMGAVIAAQFAAGVPLGEMMALNHAWAKFRPDRDYTVPFASIVSHRAAERMLVHMFGDLEYEDCWIESFACSASLTRSALVVHRRGSVARGCLASIAIPGVAPPIVGENGDLLVDGGVINNVPAALLTRGTAGAVLACDVSPMEERRPGYDTTPGAWRVLRDRWTRRDVPYYPSIFETLARVAVVASTQETRRVRETADFYVHPDVGGVGIFDWTRLEDVVEIGYRASLDRLRAWWTERTSGARPRRTSTMLQV